MSPRVAGAVLLALVLTAGMPADASANHRGNRSVTSFLPCNRPVTPPRCTSVANDIWHFVYIDESVPARLAGAMRRTIREDYDPTYLRVQVQSRITAATDVIVYAADHGENGAAGWVYCPSDTPRGVNANDDRWCQLQELHFNLNPRYAAFFADRASRDYMACHELGHTIGLHHWGNPPISEGPIAATCMTADTPDGATDLHAIDVEHISRYYSALRSAPRFFRPLEGDATTGAPELTIWSGPLAHF